MGDFARACRLPNRFHQACRPLCRLALRQLIPLFRDRMSFQILGSLPIRAELRQRRFSSRKLFLHAIHLFRRNSRRSPSTKIANHDTSNPGVRVAVVLTRAAGVSRGARKNTLRSFKPKGGSSSSGSSSHTISSRRFRDCRLTRPLIARECWQRWRDASYTASKLTFLI
jgi:hypothetical protein